MNPSPPNSNPTSIQIQNLESSIQHLTRTFKRRQRWNQFYNPKKQSNLPWRSTLANLLDSNSAHLITIFLIALDLAVCVIELSADCGRSKKQPGHEIWYHWAGVAILGVLGAKSAMQAVALGRGFFRRGGEVVDAAAVVAAIGMEVGLERVGSGMIVVVSLWRVIRVVESSFELGDGEIEGMIQGISGEIQGVKEVNEDLGRDLEEKERLIQGLQDELELVRMTPYGTPM